MANRLRCPACSISRRSRSPPSLPTRIAIISLRRIEVADSLANADPPRQSASVSREVGSASHLLSTVGAAIAGVGLGALLAASIVEIAVPILVVGLVAHLVGMLGNRRFQVASGYRPAAWEQLIYWTCWAAIAALLVWTALRVAA